MNENLSKQYAQIVAKCWADPAFKSKLLAGTNATLAAEGVSIPAGVEVRVVENSAQVVYVVLTAPPAEGELADENLTNVVGAGLALSTPCVCV
ncbi:MAG TPA: NHLP leader peptide family RiPP precursor [Burkholderiaceae bacterium]|nr:NHLP leader peptide family RiPP precursor [Burkholderiaceae bacterium]